MLLKKRNKKYHTNAYNILYADTSVCCSCWLLLSCHVFKLMRTFAVYLLFTRLFCWLLIWWNKNVIQVQEITKKRRRKIIKLLDDTTKRKSMFCDHCSSSQKYMKWICKLREKEKKRNESENFIPNKLNSIPEMN